MRLKKQFNAFMSAIAVSGRFSKATISQPDGNILIVSGEISSRQGLEDLIELARQHGFILLAQELFIPV
jgi:hypothetical protein